MSRVLLGVLGVALFGVSASARIPRYSRPPAKVAVALSERVKPYRAAPATAARPEVTAGDVISIEGLTGPIRAEQEHLLADLIANTSDRQVEEKSDYYFRLGELYAKQQRHWRLKSIELHRLAEQATDPAARARLAKEAGEMASKAKEYLLRTVKTYKTLVDNPAFRNYVKLDRALFYYGFTLQSGKYMKETRAVYDRLLKDHPSSRFVPEAHLVFADFYDEADQLADAEARYKQVLKFPKSPVYWYAQYRVGWIQLRLQRFNEALEMFFQVAQGTKADKKHERLNRAAKQDFVRAYAQIGKADKALAAFQRVDAAMALEMLHHLATVYLELGKYEHAVHLHRQLVAQGAGDPRACAWQYTAARGMLSNPSATVADKITEIEKLVKLQASLAPKLSAADADECRANASAMASELGRAFHSEGTKTLNTATYGYAARLYRAFLDGFPTDPAGPEIRFLHADALWAIAAGERNDRLQLDHFERAGDAFAEVAVTDPSRAIEAAYANVLARMNSLDDSAPRAADAEVARRKPPAPIALPPRAQKLVDAIALYAGLLKDPTHPELGAMRLAEAHLYRRHEQHDQAATLYVGLVTSHRDAVFAESAAMLALDSLIVAQRIDELLRLADKLAADTAFLGTKPELDKLVKYVRSRSMRR